MQHNSQVYLFVYRSPFSVLLYRRALLDLAYSTVAGVTLFYITRGGIKTHKLRPIYIYEWLGGYLRRFPKSFGPCWFSSIDFSLSTRLITAQRPNTVMSTGWPNNIFHGSSPPLSLSFPIFPVKESYEFEGGQGWSRLSEGQWLLRGEKKWGLIYKYRSSTGRRAFFSSSYFESKRNVFLAIDILTIEKAIECAALDLYKKKEKGNPGPIFL